MNRDQVLLHLTEAREAIERTIGAIRASPDYDNSGYWVDMQHIYHHLNTAWNSRDATAHEVASASDTDFNRWSAFPIDLPMMEV